MMQLPTLLSLLLPLALAAQLPLFLEQSSAGLARESSPAYINALEYTTLSHPSFPKHSLRIKKTNITSSEPGRALAGYIDAPGRHYYFTYFDAREKPEKAPLQLWISGGPGCSSFLAMMMENGPVSINADGSGLDYNPYSWTQTSNMIFLDQPLGVGFSYADNGLEVGTTEEAAIDVYSFLAIFIESFPEFSERPFHISGESYGGRYLPLFASEIVYQNQLLVRDNSTRKPINLESIMIGNGLTDINSMTTSYYDQACSSENGVGHPVLDIKTCITMQQEVKRCDTWVEKVCRTSYIPLECDIAQQYCQSQFDIPFITANINPYNINETCTTLAEDLCYPRSTLIKNYLDRPEVRQDYGADASLGEFEICANKVGIAFAESRDDQAPTFFHLTGLLEAGIRVLIYVGKNDWICNYIGNYRMLEKLGWSGQAEFNAEKLEAWKFEGKAIGQTKSHKGLTWLGIESAGHMVPMDRPAEALQMVSNWIQGKPL